MAKEVSKVWCIAYINSKYVDTVEKDLLHFEGVEAYVPTVRILKKTFKGKQEFEFIPLLFNYGFFRIPRRSAINPEYLSEMRENISCIYGWVKEPLRVYHTKPKLRIDNEYINNDKNIPVAVAKDHEIAEVLKSQGSLSIYSSEDLDLIEEGTIIVLKGYPFDGMDAKIVKINYNKQQVKVQLIIDGLFKDTVVSFDNVFYTIYQGGYEEGAGREKSLEEIQERSKSSDKLIANISMDEFTRE